MVYKVNEIFYTLQGEGAHMGIPAVFVRFSGCNLRCPWCDTDFASHIDMTAEQIVNEALALYDIPNERRKMLVLTGGENEIREELKRIGYTGDRIEIVLTSGRSGSADAGSIAIKVRFLPTDTIYDVCRKISAQVDSIKADEDATRLERLASTLVKTPRFVLRIGTGIIRWLDYHGWLGEEWTTRSPFHGSAVISDEGSSSLPSMSRSLNSIGCLPLSLSIGRRRTAPELTKEGLIREARLVDYTVSLDSRIADLAYIGTAFKYFRHYLSHPEELEHTPSRVNDDTL